MIELRKLIAMILLRWAFMVLPECKFKTELALIFINKLAEGLD